MQPVDYERRSAIYPYLSSADRSRYLALAEEWEQRPERIDVLRLDEAWRQQRLEEEHRKASEKLGILPYFDIEIADERFGCWICKRKQEAGSVMIWISMDVKPGDAAAAVRDADDRHMAAWCVECARGLGGEASGIADR
jgi:hypothetical protein